jgi:hypothetical protein
MIVEAVSIQVDPAESRVEGKPMRVRVRQLESIARWHAEADEVLGVWCALLVEWKIVVGEVRAHCGCGAAVFVL